MSFGSTKNQNGMSFNHEEDHNNEGIHDQKNHINASMLHEF